ncbi:MAG: ATP-binding domain-containing protein [Alistipes putredinis]|nr:MAG: ATP-binding domain-containing protein [Alistipes putredinis]
MQDVAYIQAVHEQIVSFTATRVADIELFLDWWKEQGAGQSLSMQRSSSAITVTTIHKSKGLEYPAVIVPYCSLGTGTALYGTMDACRNLGQGVGHARYGSGQI